MDIVHKRAHLGRFCRCIARIEVVNDKCYRDIVVKFVSAMHGLDNLAFAAESSRLSARLADQLHARGQFVPKKEAEPLVRDCCVEVFWNLVWKPPGRAGTSRRRSVN